MASECKWAADDDRGHADLLVKGRTVKGSFPPLRLSGKRKACAVKLAPLALQAAAGKAQTKRHHESQLEGTAENT